MQSGPVFWLTLYMCVEYIETVVVFNKVLHIGYNDDYCIVLIASFTVVQWY